MRVTGTCAPRAHMPPPPTFLRGYAMYCTHVCALARSVRWTARGPLVSGPARLSAQCTARIRRARRSSALDQRLVGARGRAEARPEREARRVPAGGVKRAHSSPSWLVSVTNRFGYDATVGRRQHRGEPRRGGAQRLSQLCVGGVRATRCGAPRVGRSRVRKGVLLLSPIGASRESDLGPCASCLRGISRSDVAGTLARGCAGPGGEGQI
jgi:hypothetical protein